MQFLGNRFRLSHDVHSLSLPGRLFPPSWHSKARVDHTRTLLYLSKLISGLKSTALVCGVRNDKRQYTYHANKLDANALYATLQKEGNAKRCRKLHWTIENTRHWSRDVTWQEDKSRVGTGAALRILANFRNAMLNGFLITI